MNKSAVIIGGGVGGLFTGAILAKEGVSVTVLEKNTNIGGGLQSFKRYGESWDTGMHVIGGMMPNGNIMRICQYLGIADRVKIKHVDDDCTDLLYFAEDKMTYRIAKGKKGFVDSLSAYFPESRNDLENYVDAIYALTNDVDLLHLRPSDEYFKVQPDEFLISAEAFIAKYIVNEKLRSVVSYMNPLYGGRHNETPAFIHAIISMLYIEGASRFVDGSDQFASLLADVIERNGGRVVVNEGVEWIDVVNRHVLGVRTKKGNVYNADYYISDIHPCTLFKLMPEKSFPKAYRDRLNSLTNAYSAFLVYIKLKPESFPYINYSEYYMSEYSKIWQFGEHHDEWPLGFMVMTPPVSHQGKYSNKVLVTAPMLFDEVKQWEETTVGHRGEEYNKWKDEKTKQLLKHIDEMHPGFVACIDKICTASPLTIRDFYGVKEGSLCGFSKDYKDMAKSQVPVVTKIDNLLLTGQNNSLHGFSGVPLTAINTAEVILGKNFILNKLAATKK